MENLEQVARAKVNQEWRSATKNVARLQNEKGWEEMEQTLTSDELDASQKLVSLSFNKNISQCVCNLACIALAEIEMRLLDQERGHD